MLLAAKKFRNLDCKHSWSLVRASCPASLCSVSSLTSRSSVLRSAETNISICLSCISSRRWRGETPSSSSHTLLRVLRACFFLVASSAAVGFAAAFFRATAANGTSSSSDSLTCWPASNTQRLENRPAMRQAWWSRLSFPKPCPTRRSGDYTQGSCRFPCCAGCPCEMDSQLFGNYQEF